MTIVAKERIEFTFKKGQVSIDAIGFTGSACEAATREVEEKLGTVTEKTRKPEWYAKAATSTQQRASS